MAGKFIASSYQIIFLFNRFVTADSRATLEWKPCRMIRRFQTPGLQPFLPSSETKRVNSLIQYKYPCLEVFLKEWKGEEDFISVWPGMREIQMHDILLWFSFWKSSPTLHFLLARLGSHIFCHIPEILFKTVKQDSSHRFRKQVISAKSPDPGAKWLGGVCDVSSDRSLTPSTATCSQIYQL